MFNVVVSSDNFGFKRELQLQRELKISWFQPLITWLRKWKLFRYLIHIVPKTVVLFC